MVDPSSGITPPGGQAITPGGKYLTFVLADEEYGIEVVKVREIIDIPVMTVLPRAPDWIKGVVNLYGQVLPVLDLRLKFGLPEAPYTAATCIIVLAVPDTLLGLVVDTVSEIRHIATDCIEAPPSFGADVRAEFIRGVARIRENVKILLDLDTVLSAEELGMLGGFDAAAGPPTK